MFKAFISITLLAAGILIFFVKSRPYVGEIKQLREQALAYDEAMTNSNKIKEKTDALLKKYNDISPADKFKLNTMLPSQFDPIIMAVELESMLKKFGMEMKTVSFKKSESSKPGIADLTNGSGQPFETADFSFQTAASYENFLSFLGSLEKTSRMIDINGIKFSSQSQNQNHVYQFGLDASVYWIKEIAR